MQYPEVIRTALEYIEQNLKANITAEDLAQMANYSTYHYYRLFSSVMGSSLAGYILKRRLDHALGEIAGGRRAIDVVLEYGFDTYAGFYKAFVKMYGCSPKKYLSIYKGHKPEKPEVVFMYMEKELRKVLKNWNIDTKLPIGDIYIMDGSRVSGKVWTVGDDYILKCGKREVLMKNIRIAKALHRQGFSSSLPVLAKDGRDCIDEPFSPAGTDGTSAAERSAGPNGGEAFILTLRLKGEPLPKSDKFGDDRISFGEKYGKSIARLHKALKTIQNDIPHDEVDLYENVTDWALPGVRRQNIQWNMGIDDSFFDDYIENFGKLYGKLPKQLIHKDPNPSNILFDGGEVSGFIDFDLSECNIRLWDVCYCATGILVEDSEDAYEKWLDILGGILRGYDQEGKLTPEEKQAVFYVICSIQMICVAYFETVDMFRELAKTNRRMLKYIIQNRRNIESLI